MQSHTNNNMLQIFFIHSIFILLITFLAVFCVDVVFAEEIVYMIPNVNLPVPALNALMKTAVDPLIKTAVDSLMKTAVDPPMKTAVDSLMKTAVDPPMK